MAMCIKSIYRSTKHVMRTRGVKGLLYTFSSRIQRMAGIRAKSFRGLEPLFLKKKGIEFGGPSQVFSKNGLFPLYPVVGSLDNCNFGRSTVWEGDISDGYTYQFDPAKPKGRQYIAEATDIRSVPSEAYDFVLASHMLEHTANPILAVTEWRRLLKEQGQLVALLPLREGNFDHRRTVTTMEHLLNDFHHGVGEDDLGHLEEILALHDLARDPEAGSPEDFKARSLHNFENRCFHHHVFDAELLVRLMEYSGMQTLAVEMIRPEHILIVAQKTGT